MSNTSATLVGHVARAVRFTEEAATTFVGYARREPWASEGNPPDADVSARNIGVIGGIAYVGTSLTSANAKAMLLPVPFVLGTVTYRVTALTADTFELRNADTNTVIGPASNAARSLPYENLIAGVRLTVSNTAMTAGDTFTFRIDGPTGYKLADKVYLVVEDAAAAPAVSIVHKGVRYRIVDPGLENPYEAGARKVFVEATFAYDELPVVAFRQIGVFSGLTRASGVASSKIALLPTEVASVGVIEVIENRPPVYRDPNEAETFGFLIEF